MDALIITNFEDVSYCSESGFKQKSHTFCDKLPCAGPEPFQAGKLVYRGCTEPAVIIRPWDPCLLMGRTFTSRGRNTGWNISSSFVLVHGDRKPILEITHTQPQQEQHLKNKSQRLYAHTMSLECLTGAITDCTTTIIKGVRGW